MSDIEAGINSGEIGEVTLEFVRGYVAVLRCGRLASTDDCLRLLLTRAKAKELLDTAAYDRAVALAHSFGASANQATSSAA
jgi:hypothetical protein